jgi:putative endonuclease
MVIHTRHKGKIGENIAAIYLERQGFKVVDRNYQKKWGEIDIIAEAQGSVHFFEVKSIAVDSLTKIGQSYRPEENVHGLKARNIRRMVETYLSEKRKGNDTEFHFHVLCVFKDVKNRMARVKWIKDVIL